MGRRSTHTSEELRGLILRAAEELITEGGLSNLSAREIAKRIGYSPGTIYNVFENLDDVMLNTQFRLLDALDAHLAQVVPDTDPLGHVKRLAHAYLDFTHDNPKLWNTLFEHHMPPGSTMPDWYRDKLESLMTRVEDALAPLIEPEDPQAQQRAARVLWAGVHGISSLSTADKLSNVTADSARILVDDLVTAFLNGISVSRAATKA